MTFLWEEEHPPVAELKFSIVDVKCRDVRGTIYVVEMQVLNHTRNASASAIAGAAGGVHRS